MASSALFVLLVLGLSSCLAETSTSDLLYWQKDYIYQWNRYFPERAIEEERLTLQAAVTAVQSLSSGLPASLGGIVAFQAQELAFLEQLSEGTDGQGCVAGIKNYISKAINDACIAYDDCAADALSKLKRLNSTWATARSRYMTEYLRVMNGIDACARNYPNKDSMGRLKSCVVSMSRNYIAAANLTQNSMFPSPTMSYFQREVIGCASDAAAALTLKGFQFLNMLCECARLSGNIDITMYCEQLSQWKGYNDTLAVQISEAQNKNYNDVWKIERQMISYHEMQRSVLEQYLIESRGRAFYINYMYKFLSDYYNTLTASSVDNPENATCGVIARAALDGVADSGANKSLACDLEYVNSTKRLIVDVHENFEWLNNKMPYVGNAAILDCISQGSVFAPNTIHDCFSLVRSGFNLDYEDRNANISQDIYKLSEILNFFYSKSGLPCGGTSSNRLLLSAEEILFKLQRCLYMSSGTTYSVTTPAPFTNSYSESTTSMTTESTPV